MPDVLMPRLSDSMEEGTILRWLKRPGEPVRAGDDLAEIETDKATVVYAADADGVLEVVADAGLTLPVGTLIARLDGGASAPAPAPARPAPEATSEAAPPAAGNRGETTVVEPNRVQQGVARRIAEAKATVPEITLFTEADVGFAVEALAQLGDPALALDDLLVKATALALRDVPRANASWRDGRFELHGRVNVGVVVPAQDGLVAPVLFDADRRPAAELARERRALTERARDGSLTAAELSGATATVSSLGEHGVTAFAAVITPPHAVAVAAGAPAPRPVARDGAVVVRPVLTVALTCDHRILYGAEAAAFLARIRALLERPAPMLGGQA